MYQKTISPDHGWFSYRFPVGYCRYSPSCSMYTYQAVERFGVIKGLFLGVRRVLRCTPWSKGGNDPIKY